MNYYLTISNKVTAISFQAIKNIDRTYSAPLCEGKPSKSIFGNFSFFLLYCIIHSKNPNIWIKEKG